MNVMSLIVTNTIVEFRLVRADTNATERNNGRCSAACENSEVRTYVRSFVVHLASPRLASSRLASLRHAGKEKTCIRRSSNSRPAFRAACILRLVPVLKFHPCPFTQSSRSRLPLSTSIFLFSSLFVSVAISVSLKCSFSLSYLCFLTASRLSLSVRSVHSPLCVPSFLSLSLFLSPSLSVSLSILSLLRTRK